MVPSQPLREIPFPLYVDKQTGSELHEGHRKENVVVPVSTCLGGAAETVNLQRASLRYKIAWAGNSGRVSSCAMVNSFSSTLLFFLLLDKGLIRRGHGVNELASGANWSWGTGRTLRWLKSPRLRCVVAS